MTMSEYDVCWGNGPLGLTLRPGRTEDMLPVVSRITRPDAAAAQNNVAPGHLLVSIEGVDTAPFTFDEVVEALRQLSRPITLRFRVPGDDDGITSHKPPMIKMPCDAMDYDIEWREGSLGLKLRADDLGVPVIRRITNDGTTNLGPARIGDSLVALNGTWVDGLSYADTLVILKHAPKPLVLRFRHAVPPCSPTVASGESRASDDYEDPFKTRILAPVTSQMPVEQVHKQNAVIAEFTSVLSEVKRSSICLDEESWVSKQEDQHPNRVVPTLQLQVDSQQRTNHDTYEVTWCEGSLGARLKAGDLQIPVISRVTTEGGCMALKQLAQVSDTLLSINGMSVEGDSFQDTIRFLKYAPKPVVLRFCRGPLYSPRSVVAIKKRKVLAPARANMPQEAIVNQDNLIAELKELRPYWWKLE